ncbi:MAG: hypothetical protein NT103_01440 [Campylobacterales bacterium]|nr:hypothetical protein [Campylobacterales bacterium]
MMKKSILVSLVAYLGIEVAQANTTEMVFYPNSDLSSAVAHFHYQGEKSEQYGLLFDQGFDKKQLLYAQPKNYTIETQKDGKVKLLFSSTDRYSYMQQMRRDDFIVESAGKVSVLLVCGGDCSSSKECVTEQNILTLMVPQGYSILSYKGLDDNLKELKAKEWKIRDGVYTLFAPNVKGACISMKLEKREPFNEKSEAKSEPLGSKVPSIQVYQNKDLFVKGDVVLSISGKGQLKKLTDLMQSGDNLSVRVFQDTVAPVRLVGRYPNAHLFSAARAEELTKQLISLGVERSRIEMQLVDDKLQKTRVETEIILAQ